MEGGTRLGRLSFQWRCGVVAVMVVSVLPWVQVGCYLWTGKIRARPPPPTRHPENDEDAWNSWHPELFCCAHCNVQHRFKVWVMMVPREDSVEGRPKRGRGKWRHGLRSAQDGCWNLTISCLPCRLNLGEVQSGEWFRAITQDPVWGLRCGRRRLVKDLTATRSY